MKRPICLLGTGLALAGLATGCGRVRTSPDDLLGEPGASLSPRFKGSEMTTAVERHTEIDTGQVFHFDLNQAGDTLLFDGTMHYAHPNLYLKPTHARGLTLRTDDPQFQYVTPKFSRKGDFIAYASDRYGNYDIFIAPATEKAQPIAVTHSPRDEAYPCWFEQHDETGKATVRKLAYCIWDEQNGEWVIQIVDILKSTIMEVTRGMKPDWSPCGRYIAFQRPRQRGDRFYSVWVYDLLTQHEQEVVSSAEWAAIQPAWSRDGRYIAFATVHKSVVAQKETRMDKGDDIWITDREGRFRIQLTQGPEPESWPVWGPNNRLYYLREMAGKRDIWSLRANILDHLGE